MQVHRSTAALLVGTGLTLAAPVVPAASLVIDDFTAATNERSATTLGSINTPVTVAASGLSGVLGGQRVVTVTRLAGTSGGNVFEIDPASVVPGDTRQAFLDLGRNSGAQLKFFYPSAQGNLAGSESIDVRWWADHVDLGAATTMSLTLTSDHTTLTVGVGFGNSPVVGVPNSLVTTSFLLSQLTGIDLQSVSAIRFAYQYQSDLASDTIFASISPSGLSSTGGTVVPLPAGAWLLAAGAVALLGLGVARSESGATPTG